MRYKTAAILAAVLIGGMFGVPAAVLAVFPTVKLGTMPVLLSLVVFCIRFKWVLALPIMTVLFTLAAFTSYSRQKV